LSRPRSFVASTKSAHEIAESVSARYQFEIRRNAMSASPRANTTVTPTPNRTSHGKAQPKPPMYCGPPGTGCGNDAMPVEYAPTATRRMYAKLKMPVTPNCMFNPRTRMPFSAA